MRTDGYKLNMSGHFWILINPSDYLMLGPLFLFSWCFWVTLRVCFGSPAEGHRPTLFGFLLALVCVNCI